MSAAICRVDVVTGDGRWWSAEIFAGDHVKLYRCGKHRVRQELGEGKLENGEILGMPGGALIDERVYAAIEGALEAWADFMPR